MKSITQFFLDSSYRAIVSPNGRYVVKHSSEEDYEGYNEIFLLYDNGKKIREIIGENCLFIGNEYLLKFPFWGYSEDCQDFNLIDLSSNRLIKISYPDDIESYLVARTAIYSKSDEMVYYFSNVDSAIKNYTKFLYSLDVQQLINNKKVCIYETSLNFIPDNTFLEYYKGCIICHDENNHVIQLTLPLTDSSKIIAYPELNDGILKISYVDKLVAIDIYTISSRMNADGSFTTKRSDIGELLYRLKYKNEHILVAEISHYVAERIINSFGAYSIDVILPIPPSNLNRKFQPVIEIVKSVSKIINIPYDVSFLIKSKQTVEIKSISNSKNRTNYMQNVFDVVDYKYKDKNVLLLDDLLRSGTTMSAAAKALKELGGIKSIFGISVTKTRTNR